QTRTMDEWPPGPKRQEKRAQARAPLQEVVRRGPYPASFMQGLCNVASVLGEPVLMLAVAEAWQQAGAAKDPRALSAESSAESGLGAWSRFAGTLDRLIALTPKAE